jgi:hypothetical protein
MKFSSCAVVLFALIIVGCGDSSGPGTGGGGPMSATIDGAAWSSQTFASQAGGGVNGGFSIVGGSASASSPTLAITLSNISEPGTYPLGVGGTVRGGIAIVGQGASSWSTPGSGSAGTIVITVLTASRIAGTFSFVATPSFGQTGANRTVTGGTFDMPLTTPGGAVPAHVGSFFTGTLNTSPWNAATVVTVSHPSSGTMTLTASNDEYIFNMVVTGFAGLAVYTLNTDVSRQMTGSRIGTLQSWGGAGGLSTGTVTVTSYSAARVEGSYNILMQPNGTTTGTLALAGTFSLGLPQ